MKYVKLVCIYVVCVMKLYSTLTGEHESDASEEEVAAPEDDAREGNMSDERRTFLHWLQRAGRRIGVYINFIIHT